MRSTDQKTSRMPESDEEALQRLATNIQDGTALFAIYNKYKKSFDRILWNYLGEEARSKKSLDAIVDRIILRAGCYDPRLESAEDWILQQVTEEAQSLKQLREQEQESRNETTNGLPRLQDEVR